MSCGADGDELAQLALGRHYMNAAQLEANDKAGASSGENARLAIYWLVRASRQGNREATGHLVECQYRQLGVDDSNAEDVNWCISTSPHEKAAREAARRLFRRLHPQAARSDHGVSKNDFLHAVAEIASNKSEKKLLEKAGLKDGNSEGVLEITETDFIDRVIRRLQGHGSSLTSGVQNDADWDAFKQASLPQKLRRYPGKTASWLVEAAVETAGSQGAVWLRSLMPVNQIYTMVAVLVYSAVSIDAVLWLLPLAAFYIAFAILTVATAQMLRSRRRLGDVQTIAGLLSRFGGDVPSFDADSAASAYSWSSLRPYSVFFAALPAAVGALHAADSAWLPAPELAAMSAVIGATCFFALGDSYDFLAVLSIAIDTFSNILPAVVRRLPPIPILHSILWYMVGPGVAVDLLPSNGGLQLMIGLPSLMFLIVPAMFVRMAARRSWRGTYQVLVPHLVCFFWWRLAVAFFLQSTWPGLARAAIGWVGFVFLLPLVPFAFLSYVGYLVFHAMSVASLIKIATTIVLIVSAAGYAAWSRSGFRVVDSSHLGLSRSQSMRAILVLAILLVSSLPLAYIFTPPSGASTDQSGTLSWQTFEQHCLPPNGSLAGCAHFAGARVTGHGTIAEFMVTRVENPTEGFAAWLPAPAANWLRCAYGQPYAANCMEEADGSVERDACIFNSARGQSCHLREFDHRTYEVKIAVARQASDGILQQSIIRLMAGDWFSKSVGYIAIGSDVSFTIVVADGTDSKLPALTGINCTSCDGVMQDIVYQHGGEWRALRLVIRAMHAICNFFLSPLVVFE